MSDAVYSTKVAATGNRHASIRSDGGLNNMIGSVLKTEWLLGLV
jgi:hypothetical protein